jgi:hypothetical protein
MERILVTNGSEHVSHYVGYFEARSVVLDEYFEPTDDEADAALRVLGAVRG